MSLRKGIGLKGRWVLTYLGITKNLRNSVQKIFESILIGEIFNHRAGHELPEQVHISYSVTLEA